MEENAVHGNLKAETSKAPCHAAFQAKRTAVPASSLGSWASKSFFDCRRESHAEPSSGDNPNSVRSYLSDGEIHTTRSFWSSYSLASSWICTSSREHEFGFLVNSLFLKCWSYWQSSNPSTWSRGLIVDLIFRRIRIFCLEALHFFSCHNQRGSRNLGLTSLIQTYIWTFLSSAVCLSASSISSKRDCARETFLQYKRGSEKTPRQVFCSAERTDERIRLVTKVENSGSKLEDKTDSADKETRLCRRA